MKATGKQLNYIAFLRNTRNYENSNINVNELFSDNISKFTASTLIEELLKCEEKEVETVETKKIETVKYSVNDKINHNTYGIGKVAKVKSKSIIVEFETKTAEFTKDSSFINKI